MELGFFCSSRKKILLWIMGPILGILICNFIFSFYLKDAHLFLEEHMSMIESMPMFEQKIAMANRVIDQYKIEESGSDAIEIPNKEINSIASDSNFIINSLAIDKAPQQNLKSGASLYDLEIKGEGSLSAITALFNSLYRTNRLFSIERVKLSVTDRENASYYKAELELSYCTVNFD